MAILLREQLNKRLGRPSLVRKTSRVTYLGEFTRKILNMVLRRKEGREFDDVVLHPKLQEQVFRLANATANAKKRNMNLMHVMFYGPPGTGKTMTAQRFAEYSGLEYAFMSGADVAPLEEQAVTELHKLFSWVHKSRKGVLLFIDEADAFLCQRNKNMSEQLRNAITTMLYHTGTLTSQFLMVLATNRPGDLDPAVLDRIDESVEFGLPDFNEREKMVGQYFNQCITGPLKIKLQDHTPKVIYKNTAFNKIITAEEEQKL
jgi:ATPase family AAA domain-containing protein 3A/B